MPPALSAQVTMEHRRKECRPESHHSHSSRRKRASSFKAVILDSVSITVACMTARVVGSYDPHHRHRPNSAAVKSDNAHDSFGIGYVLNTTGLKNHLSKVLGLLRTTLLHITKKDETDGNMRPEISSLSRALHCAKFFEGPPSLLFIAACVSFVFAIAALRYSHRNDRYQGRIIVGGAVAGMIMGYKRQDTMTETIGWLAWSMILGLIFSSLVHRVMSLWPDPYIPESLESEGSFVASEKEIKG